MDRGQIGVGADLAARIYWRGTAGGKREQKGGCGGAAANGLHGRSPGDANAVTVHHGPAVPGGNQQNHHDER